MECLQHKRIAIHIRHAIRHWKALTVMKTYEELAEENEKLKNKILLLEKLNQDAFARLLEESNEISYYEQAMKVERYNVWK